MLLRIVAIGAQLAIWNVAGGQIRNTSLTQSYSSEYTMSATQGQTICTVADQGGGNLVGPTDDGSLCATGSFEASAAATTNLNSFFGSIGDILEFEFHAAISGTSPDAPNGVSSISGSLAGGGRATFVLTTWAQFEVATSSTGDGELVITGPCESSASIVRQSISSSSSKGLRTFWPGTYEVTFGTKLYRSSHGTLGKVRASATHSIILDRATREAPGNIFGAPFIDINNDTLATIDDLVDWFISPVDANADGVIDSYDRDWIVYWLRLSDVQVSDCDKNGIPDVLEIEADPLLDLDDDNFLDICQSASMLVIEQPTTIEAGSFGSHVAIINNQLLVGGGRSVNGAKTGGLAVYRLDGSGAPTLSQVIELQSPVFAFADVVYSNEQWVIASASRDGGFGGFVLFEWQSSGLLSLVDSQDDAFSGGARLAGLTDHGLAVTSGSRDGRGRLGAYLLSGTGIGPRIELTAGSPGGRFDVGMGTGQSFIVTDSGIGVFGNFSRSRVRELDPEGHVASTLEFRQNNQIDDRNRSVASSSIDGNWSVIVNSHSSATGTWAHERVGDRWIERQKLPYISGARPRLRYPYLLMQTAGEIVVYEVGSDGIWSQVRKLAAPASTSFASTADIQFPQLAVRSRQDGLAERVLLYDLLLGGVSDCDGNRRPDEFEIKFGQVVDSNSDWILDSCQPCVIANREGIEADVNAFDVLAFLNEFNDRNVAADLELPVGIFDASDTAAFLELAIECIQRQVHVDDLEDIAEDNAVVELREVAGVAIAMKSTLGTSFRSCTYGDSTPTAFNDQARGPNVPFDFDSAVLGKRFISTLEPLADTRLGRAYMELVFEMSEPVAAFGFTTMDVLQKGQPFQDFLILAAFDEAGELVATQRRDGEQGPSGIQLDWFVEDPKARIVRVTLGGSLTRNARYGVDNLRLRVR